MLSYWEALAYALWASAGITIGIGIETPATTHWVHVTIALLLGIAGATMLLIVRISRLADMIRAMDRAYGTQAVVKMHEHRN